MTMWSNVTWWMWFLDRWGGRGRASDSNGHSRTRRRPRHYGLQRSVPTLFYIPLLLLLLHLLLHVILLQFLPLLLFLLLVFYFYLTTHLTLLHVFRLNRRTLSYHEIFNLVMSYLLLSSLILSPIWSHHVMIRIVWIYHILSYFNLSCRTSFAFIMILYALNGLIISCYAMLFRVIPYH